VVVEVVALVPLVVEQAVLVAAVTAQLMAQRELLAQPTQAVVVAQDTTAQGNRLAVPAS
jgi:hypothetical protein